jgi:hypothetical protein
MQQDALKENGFTCLLKGQAGKKINGIILNARVACVSGAAAARSIVQAPLLLLSSAV